MASITKRTNGAFTVQFYWEKTYPRKLHLKTKVRREAERVADYVQNLVDSRNTGTTISHDVEIWLARLRDDDIALYDKLANMGLVKAKEKPKTLKELIDLFLLQDERKTSTLDCYRNTAISLFLLLGGENRSIETITTEEAAKVVAELKSQPLNRRNKNPSVYATATVSRSIVRIRSIFSFAEKIGWVKKSPFRFCKSGSQVNYSRWRYISKKTVAETLEHSKNVKWKAIMALGRFAGCRGSSELFNLTWKMVNFDEQTIILHATKKEAFADVERAIPMNNLLTQALLDLRKSQQPGTTRLFPGMEEKDNTSTVTGKMFTSAGKEDGPEPWYNLRRSFCSDVMESGVDPKVYEAICGHSFETGMKHYQILHPDRKARGISIVRKMLNRIDDEEADVG